MTTDLTWIDELDVWKSTEPAAAPTPVPAAPRPTAGGFQLAPQQQEAADKILDWYQDPDRQVFRLFGYAGTGKALRYDQPVLTPAGWREIGRLQMGDAVTGSDGQPTTVTGVYPQGIRELFEVVISDGTTIVADADHLWLTTATRDRDRDRPAQVRTTAEIAATVKLPNGRINHYLPRLTAPVSMPHTPPLLDPYLVGVLLGDGGLSGPAAMLSTPDAEILASVEAALPGQVRAVPVKGSACDYRLTVGPNHRINPLTHMLRRLGLQGCRSAEKFIPNLYLNNSTEVRLGVLQGLLDTDGSAAVAAVEYSTASKMLADQVTWLVQSLGGFAKTKERATWYTYKGERRTGQPSYRLRISLPADIQPFRLARKRDAVKVRTRFDPYRQIVEVRPVPAGEAVCISVAAPDSLYVTAGCVLTHNTSTARQIVDSLGVQSVEFAAFTGKAAYVLRTKGCEGAATIHSMIYQPREKLRAHLEELQRELDRLLDPDIEDTPADPFEADRLKKAIAQERRKIENPDWILREPDECVLPATDLLVIDEVSMVNDRMGTDLLSYGCKTLVLGDPAQLPPVEGGGYFINKPADHLLTEIHRSALDSPVTRLATAARSAQQGDRLYGINGTDGDSGRRHRLTFDEFLSFDQVLVGTNRARWQVIHLVRGLRGLTGVMPQPGDRIMTLANSSDAEVFNGQQFTVQDARPHPLREDQFRLEVTDDEGNTRPLSVWADGFTDVEGEKKAKRNGRGTVAAATFAQAITTHKAQGSQWDSVLVVDESGVFADMAHKGAVRVLGLAGADAEAHRAGQRWLYTALTRAARRVVIVPQINGLLGGSL